MKSFHVAVIIFAVLLVSACGAPQFNLGRPPVLSVADIVRPTPPAARLEDPHSEDFFKETYFIVKRREHFLD